VCVARHVGVLDPRQQGQEWGRPPGGVELGGAERGRKRARAASGVRVCVPEALDRDDEQHRLAASAQARWIAAGANHDLKHTFGRRPGGGSDVRGPLGSPRSSLRTHHRALLGRGVGEPDRGREQGVRRRVPQNSRTRDPEKTSARRGNGKRMICG